MAAGGVRSFICDQCSNTLKEKDYLIAHIRVTHGKSDGFTCDLCSKEFPSKGSLLPHIRVQHDGCFRRFKCQMCAADYKDEGNLQRHKNNFHKGIRFECDDCGKMAGEKHNLNKHISAVHQKLHTTLQCLLYGVKSVSSSDLKRHSTAKHNSTKLQCDECDAKFWPKIQLAVHIPAVHMKLLQFKCDQCPAAFNCHSYLHQHKQGVHANNSFICDVCSKILTTQRALVAHSTTHMNMRPVRCDLRGNSDLNRHKQHIHNKMRAFMCDPCSKVLCDKGRLTSHYFGAHMELYQFKCSVCGQTFKRRETLSNHKKIHR